MFVPCKSQERAGERFCLQNWPYKNWSQEKKSIPKSTRFTRSFIEWASGHTQLNIYPQKVSIMTVYFAARWDTWKQPCLYNDSRPETTHKRLFLFWLYQVIQAPNQNPRLYNGYQWMLKYRVSTETQDEKGVCVCVCEYLWIRSAFCMEIVVSFDSRSSSNDVMLILGWRIPVMNWRNLGGNCEAIHSIHTSAVVHSSSSSATSSACEN